MNTLTETEPRTAGLSQVADPVAEIFDRIHNVERDLAAIRLKAATIRHQEELDRENNLRELGIEAEATTRDLARQQLAEAPQPDASEDEPVLDPAYAAFLQRKQLAA